jgi:CheY-like chemotaxis protein
MGTKGRGAVEVRILLAEDNQVLRGVVSGILEQAGHQVTTRSCGLRTLRTLTERKFDLLVMDLNLPGMTGDEVIRNLPELNHAIPVLLVSGAEPPPIVGRPFEYMQKPFAGAELLAKAQAIVSGGLSERLQEQQAV